MTKQNCQFFGIAGIILCAVLIFVAVERYQNNVNALNTLQGVIDGSNAAPPGTVSLMEMEPKTPTITKYALFFAILAGAGGIYFLIQARPGGPRGPGAGGQTKTAVSKKKPN